MSRERSGAGKVVLAWGVANALLATGLFAFVNHEPEKPIFYSSAALVVIAAVIFGVSWGRRPQRREAQEGPEGLPPDRSGGPALAFAAACLAGALAWVFGVWLAYLAIAPLAYCVTALRAERKRARS